MHIELTTVTAIAGLVFGTFATCLSIYNTLKQNQKDKVKLKVEPKIYQNHGNRRKASSIIPENINEWDGVCVEIINMSTFSVTIDEIGLSRIGSDERMIFPQLEITAGKKPPYRLESRTSVVCYIPLPGKLELPATAKCFYATTACGTTVTGTSEVANWLIQQANR